VRLRAVVVDPEPAADVEEAQALAAEPVELDVEAAGLEQRVLDRADVRDLRAEVEVDELEAAELPPAAQLLDGREHLLGRQAELGAVAARLLPLAGPARRQAGADADARDDAELAGDAVDLVELARLLDDDDDLAPQLRGHQRHPDVLLVLVAVADDE